MGVRKEGISNLRSARGNLIALKNEVVGKYIYIPLHFFVAKSMEGTLLDVSPLALGIEGQGDKKVHFILFKGSPLFNTKVDTRETNSIDKRARNARK